MVTLEEVRKIKDKYKKELMKKYGVLGCGVGYKYVNGKKTDQLCIICYVKEKKPEKKIKKKDIIPKKIEGIATDVIESGEIRAL